VQKKAGLIKQNQCE